MSFIAPEYGFSDDRDREDRVESMDPAYYYMHNCWESIDYLLNQP